MTDPVVTKLFRNGGSWAVRIPAALVPPTNSVEIRGTPQGTIEILPHEEPDTLDQLLERWSSEPTPADAQEPWPPRTPLSSRFPDLGDGGAE